MSVPKKRRTASSRKRRGSHHRLTSASLKACSECGAQIAPHRACPECGFYKKEKKVLARTDRASKKKTNS
jgi:large subunit ribosomal protein L32